MVDAAGALLDRRCIRGCVLDSVAFICSKCVWSVLNHCLGVVLFPGVGKDTDPFALVDSDT